MMIQHKRILGKNWHSAGAILCALALCLTSACTKNENNEAPSSTETSAAKQEAQATPSSTATATPTSTTSAPRAAGGGPTVTLDIGTDGNNLYYNKKTLDVKAGSTIQLTFKNNATADSGLTHNWVLAKPGTADQVANEGMQAGDANGWVPSNSPNVLAHTKLLKSGESETVTFTAPPAGDYPYFCTFPGHSATMKGVLHSK